MEELDVNTLRNDYQNHPDYLLDLLDKKCPELLDILYPVYNAEDAFLIKRRRSTAYICLLDYVCRTSHISVTKDAWGQYGSNMREEILSDIHNELVDEGKEIDDGIGEEQQQAVRRIIYDICKRNAEIREMIFKSDKELFESCNTKKEFENFVLNHTYSYPEYLLHAKYKIAKITHTPFTDLQIAKEQYGDCEWVKNIKSKETSSGLIYMITEDAKLCKEEELLIMSFLEGFTYIISNSKAKNTTRKGYFRANEVVTVKLWNIVMGHNPFSIRNDNTPKLVTYNEIDVFIQKLQQMVCAKFRIQNSEEMVVLRESKMYKDKNFQPIWEWCLSEEDYPSKALVACDEVEKSVNNNNRYLYYVPKSCYAACRLIIEF